MREMTTGAGFRNISVAGALLIAGLAPLGALAAEPAADPWPQLRKVLFADRPISEHAADVIGLDAPTRAEDAAVVPIAIRARAEQSPENYIRKIYLVIDKNPSPLGVVFTLTPDSGRADIETRVRIEEYTDVRAIAEMNDGRLYMAKRFVKASGGCSAPAGKDLQEAMARLGKMKFRVDGEVKPGRPALAQLMISHPNVSGLAMDQLTRLYAPPHFVRRVDVTYGGRPIISAEVDFTISENPNFRFYFVPRGEGELKAEVVDTNDLRFENSILVKPGAGGGS
jgi:sulfur-oxidizing protein SoxY